MKRNKSKEESKSKQKNKKAQSAKVQEMQNEIAELNQSLEECNEKYIRLFAEFENFKKRNTRERVELIQNASQSILSALLPVLDDFDRAKKSADDQNSKEQFSEGVELVYNKLNRLMESKGLKKMETDGEVFNPELHEAIAKVPAPSEDLKGKIIDTIEPGYLLHDKIIRHAKVVVGE